MKSKFTTFKDNLTAEIEKMHYFLPYPREGRYIIHKKKNCSQGKHAQWEGE
jgi:hypothetical protein